MQSAIVESPTPPGSARNTARSTNDLVNLAAPLLELVLKLQTGTVAPSNDVRPVVDDLLRQLEHGGAQIRCHPQHLQAVKFALVAFIDETMLSPKNNFPLREEWERNPLQLEYFKEHLAGVKFFERLDAMLADIAAHADVVEVYYLCLILGFKGKYNIHFLEEQLRDVVRSVTDQLRAVDRLKPNQLSAHWLATDQPEVPRDRGLPVWVKIGGPAALALILVTYLILYFLLQRELTVVR